MDTQNLVIVERPSLNVYDQVLRQLRSAEVYTLPQHKFGKVRLVTKAAGSKRALILAHPQNENGIQPMNSLVLPESGGSIGSAFVVFEFDIIEYQYGDEFDGGKVLDFKIWQEVTNRYYVGIRSFDLDAVEKGDVVSLRLQNEQYHIEPQGIMSAETLEFARKYIRVFTKRIVDRLPVQDARKKLIADVQLESPYVKYMMQERKIKINATRDGFVLVKKADRTSEQKIHRALIENPAVAVPALESASDDDQQPPTF